MSRPNRTPTPRSLALCLASGLLLIACFHPGGPGELIFVALVPWFRVLLAARLRDALIGSYLAATVWFLGGVWWLGYVTPGALWGCTLASAVYLLAFAIFARVGLARLRLSPALVLSIAFVGVEYLRALLFFTAFPWLMLGQALIERPTYLQICELHGIQPLSLLIAYVNAYLAAHRWPGAAAPRRRLEWALAGLIALPLVYGLIRPLTLTLRDGPTVTCIQGNIPQDLKEDAASWTTVWNHYLELSLQAYERKQDLLLWPETMLPLPFEETDIIRERIRDLAARSRATVIAGGLHRRIERGADGQAVVFPHNSAFSVHPDGRIDTRYDKIALVPVSEYIPFRDTCPPLARFFESLLPPGFDSFEAGREVVIIDAGGHKVAPHICFEVSFADLMNRMTRAGAEVLVGVSNDAWFDDSTLLERTRDFAVLRAIETRRAVVRCVNAGISGFVDADGTAYDLRDGLGRRTQVQGVLTRTTRTTAILTPYVRTGDILGPICVALCFAIALLALVPGPWWRRRDCPA